MEFSNRTTSLFGEKKSTRFLARTLFFLFLFVLNFGFNAQELSAQSALVQLRFNEGTGTTTADASGNNHNGTLTNGPVWGAGKYGQGITFDGTNDFVNIADHNNFTLNPAQSYTWSAWVTNNNFNQWSTVWSQTVNSTNFFYFYTHTTTDAEAGPVTSGVTAYWYNGSNRLVIHSNNNVLTTGQWSYVTVTYNGSLAQISRFTIYVNGVDVTNRTDVVSTGTVATINPTNIRIGSNAPFGEYLNGSIDEVRYYNRLLSVAEIVADMNTGNTPDTESPTVSVTSPAAGNVNGTINVNATAADNIGVTGVQFLLDGVNLGSEDLTAPYTVSWNTATATNGSHTLTARARDAAGNTTTSSQVVVTVNNTIPDTQAPTVAITAPGAGNVSGTVNVNSNASDNVGVVGVQFLLDGANLGSEDLTAPYTVSWNTTTATNGSHTLTARARDAAGNTTTSSQVVVTVNNTIPDTQAPTVAITAPGAGNVSGTVNVNSNASDNVGVVGVQFLLDGVNLGSEDLTSPYTVSWNTTTATNGSHTLTARARDAAGNTTTSSSIAVTVNNVVVTGTPILALGINEGSGTTTADISGNGHNGTLTSNPTWGAGKYGQGLTFNGTSNYINIPDHNNFTLNPAQSYTWSAWVRNNNFNQWGTVWGQTLNTSTHFYFYAHTTADAEAGPVTNGITVYWYNGSNKLVVHSNNNVLTAGQWSNITVTYDASQPQNNRFTIYVNGTDVTARTDVASSGTIASINPTNIRIGANQPFGDYLNGSVDEVRFYNRLLSATEVMADMNIPIGVTDNTAPTVSVSSPAGGATVSGTVSVTANATDNIGVAGVQFLLNGVNLGAEDLTSPYSVSWNTTTATNGSYTLTARARDAAGNVTTSSEVIVTVDNDTQSPIVSITSPAAGTVSATINVDAIAGDNVGIVGVQFLLDGVNLGAEDLIAPYSVSWNTVATADGNHSLTARARDAAGNITTSTAVVVNVLNNIPDTESPTVAITSPPEGLVSGTIDVNALASDNIGVAGVQFLLDGVNIGTEDQTAPYSVSWNTTTATNGSHSLTARARDAAGNITTSIPRAIIVNNDIQSPAVSITSPAAGNVAGLINVDATASDNVGVVGVQFLLDGVNLGSEDMASPFSVSWNTTTAANGSHTLTARARDAAGNTTTSSSVVVNVNNVIVVPGNLIAGLGINEGSGTTTADVSGNNHTGTLVNGPTWTLGKYGNGLSFNGTSNYVNIADHNNFTLDPAQNYTWSAWVRNTNFNQWGTVWSQTVSATNFFYFYAHTTSDAEAGPVTQGVSVYWYNGSNRLVVHSNNNVLTAGQWSHVTVTYNASQPQNNRFTIYINGVDATNRTDVVSSGTITSINPTGIRIGTNEPFEEYLNGAVDEVRFYNKLLSPSEVAVDMNLPVGTSDNTTPVVSITSPLNGATVAETVTITANATDNIGVVGVQFTLDGVNLGAEDLTAPYSVTWNTSTAAPGPHVLAAFARDASGNLAVSSFVTVNIIPDFSITLQNPTRQTGTTGTTDFKADIAFLNGFTSNNISLSVSGLPANVTGSFVTNPLTGAGTAQLNITATNAVIGSYPFTISATAEGKTHSQQATLVITGPEDFALQASPASNSVVAGNAATYTINLTETGDFTGSVTLSAVGLPSGVSASFNPATVTPAGSTTLTLTTMGSAAEGTYNITVQGVSGFYTRTVPITLTISSIPPGTLQLPQGFSVINIGGASWNFPMGTAFTSDGQRMFVWEKGGKVFVCNRNSQQLYDKQNTPVIDIEAEVGNWGDHGLMSVALDPAFNTTTGGYIYLSYVVDRRVLLNNTSIPADQGFAATIGRVTRFKVIVNANNEMIMDPSPSERKILIGETKETGVPMLHDSHGMGTIVFAFDGTLLVSAGDGASYANDDWGNEPTSYYAQALADGIIRTNENVGAFRSQMLNSHNGKILRIDPATGDGISSNPYYDALTPRSPKSRVWALGLRNPYRITVKPGSGSTNPAAGDIGEIYVGDVGYVFWEELNIINAPGVNCGWPLFEGLQECSGYISAPTLNRDEPNPLAGGSCAAFFTFKQLLKQATADGITTVFNPCSPSTPIPGSSTSNRFFHHRPSMDWHHTQVTTRVGVFNGNNAAVANIGTAASGVIGTQFRGNASVGGCWYTGNSFPAEYHDTYFHGDYGAQWLKNFKIEFTDQVQKVDDFASGFGAIIHIVMNPADGSLYVIDIGDNSIKRISYGGNQFPVLKMSSDKIYGSGPLTVNFTGSNSSDPEDGALTYLWEFGDNTTSTLANPSHVFTAPANTPTKFTVKLTVKDNLNASITDSIIISVNNTPPVVNITSPVKNSLYNVGTDTTYNLTATVTDAEHSAGQLRYEWQTSLRHNNHEHPGPIDTRPNTTSIIGRVGCNGDEYYWFFTLKVIDAAGLSTIDSAKIFPNCAAGLIAQTEKGFVVVEPDINKLSTDRKLIVSPNPVTGNYSVQYNAEFTGQAVLRIYDLNGKLVSMNPKAVQKGTNIIQMNTLFNKPGMYILSVQQGNKMQSVKLIYNPSQGH